jgi:hypothetical protein
MLVENFGFARPTKAGERGVLLYITRSAVADREQRNVSARGHARPRGTGDTAMEQLFCPNQHCATEAWLVTPARYAAELWTIESRFGDSSYTVAASDPVCPHCGTTLCAAVELWRRDERILQSGAMLDYVRTFR